jgi:hypothetical protein
LVRQDSEAARRYVERELGLHIADPFIGLLVEKDGKQVGAVILNDYTPSCNIEITVAASGPWSIADIRGIARYCFSRVERITARTRPNNLQAIERLKSLGFKYEGLMRKFFGNEDAAVFGLLKSEQRIFR